jgi:hypothetical protein
MAVYSVYLRVCAGLANRLRALVSGICAAEDLQRKLVVCWPIEPVCGAPWTDLFDSSDLPDWLTIQTVEFKGPLYTCLTQQNWDAIPKNGPIEIQSYGHFYRNDQERWLRWLRSLKPKKAILDRVDRIISHRQPIGVHIRRTDHQIAIKNSPTARFIEEIGKYPNTLQIWLATDDENERMTLERIFGEQILLVRPGTLNRNYSEAIRSALVEFIGLSRCTEIWGSAGSSFSEMAAAYGGCPLRSIT